MGCDGAAGSGLGAGTKLSMRNLVRLRPRRRHADGGGEGLQHRRASLAIVTTFLLVMSVQSVRSRTTYRHMPCLLGRGGDQRRAHQCADLRDRHGDRAVSAIDPPIAPGDEAVRGRPRAAQPVSLPRR